MKKITLILLLCFLLCSCGKKPLPDKSAKPSTPKETVTVSENIINMFSIRENDLNPLLASSESGRLMFYLVYKPLVNVGQDFNYIPELAESITPTEDAMSYSVRIKNGISWSDGSQFSAEDVCYTMDKIISYGENSPYFDNLSNVVSYTSTDSGNLVIKLNSPDSGFPNLLSFPIVKNGSLNNGINMVGTGDYVISDYIEFTSFTLVPRNGSGQIISVTLLPDKSAAFSSYKLGNLNILKTSAEDTLDISFDSSKNFLTTNTNKYTFLAVDTEDEKLSDPALRRIICEILSESKIINDLIPEYAVAADSFVNPASSYAVKNENSYDDIKSALESIGYVADETGVRYKQSGNTKTMLSVNLLVNKDNASKLTCAEYIANLLKTYGFSVSISQQKYDSYLESLTSGTFDLALCETSISLNNNYSYLIGTEGSANFGSYSSDEADNLLALISSTTDQTQKAALIQQLQSLFFNEMPHIPLWFKTSKIVYDTTLLPKASIGAINNEFSTISTWGVS